MRSIVFVTRSALPRRGGIEAHLGRVAQGLAERGNSMTVFAARIDDQPFTRLNTTIASQRFDSFERNGVRTSPLPLSTIRRAMMLPAAAGALKGADTFIGYDRLRQWTLPSIERPLANGFKREFPMVDVVHAWGGEPLMFGPLNAIRTAGKPFVITPFAHPEHWGDDPLNSRLYSAADAVIALLPSEANFYESLGVQAGRIHVIPVGAPPPLEGEQVTPQGAASLVLCLGVKRRYKYKALLDAIPRIQRRDVRFAFVGPETPESQADFATYRDDRIIRAGEVSEEVKWGWLGAADVLCLPSVSEILPVSILEAWQKRTPVVVAEGRFTRDLVSDGEDGFICRGDADSIAKAVENSLADPDRLTAMGRAGAAKVAARFDPAKVVAEHEALYASLA